MADKATLFDQVVENRDFPIDPVSFLLIVKIGLIAVVGSSFFALTAGNIAIIAVIVAFTASLVYSNTIAEGAIYRSNMSPWEGAAAYWIPQFIFFIPGVVLILESVVTSFVGNPDLAFSFGASETYLSFIADAEPWFVDVVNYDLATHIENWLIIPSGAVIYSFIKRYTSIDSIFALGLAAFPMAVIFGVLHGVSALAFFLFAFSFMFLLIVGIGYEDINPGTQIPLGLATLTASIGFHRGFNIGSLQELLAYYGELFGLQGDFAVLGIGIFLIDFIILIIFFAGLSFRAGDLLG
jgi:hypothetical protein